MSEPDNNGAAVRLRRIRVSDVLLADFLHGRILGSARWTTTPADLRIVGASFDHDGRAAEFVAASESFSPAPAGEPIPYFTPFFSSEETPPFESESGWRRVEREPATGGSIE